MITLKSLYISRLNIPLSHISSNLIFCISITFLLINIVSPASSLSSLSSTSDSDEYSSTTLLEEQVNDYLSGLINTKSNFLTTILCCCVSLENFNTCFATIVLDVMICFHLEIRFHIILISVFLLISIFSRSQIM